LGNGSIGQSWAKGKNVRTAPSFQKSLKIKTTNIFGMMPHDLATVVFELSRVSHDRLAMEYEDQMSFLSRKLCEANWKYEKLKEVLTVQKQQIMTLTSLIKKDKGNKVGARDTADISKASNVDRDVSRAVVSRDGISETSVDRNNSNCIKSSGVFSSSDKAGENIFEDHPFDRHVEGRAQTKLSLLSKSSPQSKKEASNFIDLPTVVSGKGSFFDSPNSPVLLESSNKKRKVAGIDENFSNRPPKVVALSNPDRTVVSKYHQDRVYIDIDETEDVTDNILRNHPLNGLTNSEEKPKGNIKKLSPPKPLTFHQKISRNSMISKNDNTTASSRQIQLSKPIANMRSNLRCVEVIRKKDERAALRGHQCDQCEAFYNVQIEQGILDKSKVTEFLQLCSRHKAKWTPPQTPEGFWDLSVRTPDEWKR
jgi:hypothetical protein